MLNLEIKRARFPGAQGLSVVAIHSGVTLAPAPDGLVANMIVDGHAPEALKPFSLERLQKFR